MVKAQYETVVANDDEPTVPPDKPGLPGKLLFRLRGSIRWYVLAVGIYAIAGVGAAVYVLRCARPSPTSTVLPTGNLKVDSFYSGVALSVLLTPAAIMIRRIAYELALLHPFAIASTHRTDLADLDTLMDPGFSAAFRLFVHAPWAGIVQATLLIVGAVLVPVGTLLVYTGTYDQPVSGIAAVGLPTAWNNIRIMASQMSRTPDDGQGGDFSENGGDFFLDLIQDMFKGSVVRLTGVIPASNSVLGPTSTPNLTYVEGVRYHGIVTYTWTSGCNYTDSINFTETSPHPENEWLYNITFPTGAVVSNVDAWSSSIFVANTSSENGIITTYYAVIGAVQATVNTEAAKSASAITITNGGWISRVSCTPTFDWQVSTCTYRNGSMTDCEHNPGGNTTELDNQALDTLVLYMSGIPLVSWDQGDDIFGMQTMQAAIMFDPQATNNHQYRAPLLSDYNNMYGLVAQSLTMVTTSGFFGVAEVPTTGSHARPAYMVRIYILAIVVTALVVCPTAATLALYRSVHRRIPLRRATFLTIATAVRGPSWDATLFGGCVKSDKELKKDYRGVEVMFGVDEKMPNHVGFAPVASRIREDGLYFGYRDEGKLKRATFRGEWAPLGPESAPPRRLFRGA
jgi:hypothetical protein